ncbi:MAG: ankyrin repeat domain-containing protein [Nitrospinota bacterium]
MKKKSAILFFLCIFPVFCFAKQNHEEVFAKVKTAVRLKNYGEAIALLSGAAGKGNVKAQYQLAVFYRSGKGIKKDYKKAFMWFKKAAENKDKKAQYNLGVLYEKGLGTKENKLEALKWYRLSAAQGHSMALSKLETKSSFKASLLKKKQEEKPFVSKENIEDQFLWAASAGHLKKVEAILRQKIDVNIRDSRGRTALIESAAQGHLKIVDLLRKGGSKTNLADKFGYTGFLSE